MFAQELHNKRVESTSKLNFYEEARNNDNYRKEILTTNYTQYVVMSLNPKEKIDIEMHTMVDQEFVVVSGNAEIYINLGNNKEIIVPIDKNHGPFVVMAGTHHEVRNPSDKEKLKLLTKYTPPNHLIGTIQKTKI